MASYRKLSDIGYSKNKENYEKIINVTQIKTIQDKENLIRSNKVCVIDVYADWCGPCKLIAPEFEKLFKKYNINGVCALAKEDVELKLSPSVKVVPTTQFYIDGKFDSIVTGADLEGIENKIKELLKENFSNEPPKQ